MSDYINENAESVAVEEDSDFSKPKLYSVILHNDNYTTMEFVVSILIEIFFKSYEEAQKIMLDVHRSGKGIVGLYTFDMAITKIEQVNIRAKEKNFPLKCSYQPQ